MDFIKKTLDSRIINEKIGFSKTTVDRFNYTTFITGQLGDNINLVNSSTIEKRVFTPLVYGSSYLPLELSIQNRGITSANVNVNVYEKTNQGSFSVNYKFMFEFGIPDGSGGTNTVSVGTPQIDVVGNPLNGETFTVDYISTSGPDIVINNMTLNEKNITYRFELYNTYFT